MKLKYRILFLFLFSFLCINSFAQSSTAVITQETMSSQEGYPVDARPLLEKLSKAAGIDLNNLEPVPPKLGKVAWSFSVGSKGPYSDGWWAHDLSEATISFYQTPATCRAVGDNCYIFVEDAQWNNGRVDQNAVNKVLEAFDSKNALPSSTKGIYDTNVEFFGNPPNVDGDPKIIILILDIIDGYTTGGAYTAGYFYSYNQGNSSNSNKAEVFYLDANPLNLKTDNGINTGMSITAHEFQHMIHYNYPPSSITFFNESFSEIASYLNGYTIRGTTRYANETNQYLFRWRDDDNVLTDYARAARYALYLSEQISPTFFKTYLQNSIRNEAGVTLASQTLIGAGARNFESLLEDWFIANYLNDRSVDTRYGYILGSLPKGVGITYANPNVGTTMGSVSKYGVQYITYNNGSNLTINFNNNGNNALKVKAIKIGNNSKAVENVPTNTNVNFSDFGTTYTEITFAVYVADEFAFIANPSTDKFNFIYTSSGTAQNFSTELKHDDADTKPVLGAFTLTSGDTIAVIFTGLSGTKLQKIRVGLRNTNQINGRIYRATGINSRPLGQPLSSEFTLTGNSTPSAPFTAPWSNMVELDLYSQNIDTGQRFAVAFFYRGTTGNNIVVVDRSPAEYYFSLTYLNNPSSGTPGWYFLTTNTSSGTVSALYVVRAFIGSGPTDLKDEIELLPSSYTLEQNYPNPFNPETVISFSLPKSGNVQIKVYDVLGKEIKTLMSEERMAGNHKIYWNATDDYGRRVSSGVYFYTISSGDFVQTKKMVLMK